MSPAVVFAVLIAAGILLGWIVPLALGITRARRKSGGTGLIVFGAIWGFLGICGMLALGFGYFAFRSFNRTYEPREFDARHYDGKTGTVILSYNGRTELELQDQKNHERLLVFSTNGVLVAPVGSYSLSRCRLVAADEQEKQWDAYCFFRSAPRTFVVREDVPAQLDIGPPFTARVKAEKRSDGNHALSFILTDRADNQFAVYGPSPRIPPSFETLSVDGRVVWTGKFQYG